MNCVHLIIHLLNAFHPQYLPASLPDPDVIIDLTSSDQQADAALEQNNNNNNNSSTEDPEAQYKCFFRVNVSTL